VADGFRYCGRRPKQMLRSRDVGESLVDGNALDPGCEVSHHCHDGIAETLIVLEVAAHKDELRTKLARLPAWHRAVHAEGLGFIRGSKHNTTANGHGSVTQRRVEQLLDRSVERVEVGMENSGRRFHAGTQMEQKENTASEGCQTLAIAGAGSRALLIIRCRLLEVMKTYRKVEVAAL
jgi:hypothetical protein